MEKGKILLHACCGVCSSHCVRFLKACGWEPILFFSNFNIFPHAEYLKRREALKTLAQAESVPWVEDVPDHDLWREEVAEGYERFAEGGSRCRRCFYFSLKRAFRACDTLGCPALTTSLTVSPHKSSPLLHQIGGRIGDKAFIPYDFKKQNGYLKSGQIARELGLYRQTYCGCEFSMRGCERA